MLSPGRPLGDAPVPIDPGVEVFGTPGWLMPVLRPVVPVAGAVDGGGVAGETPGEPAAEPPGEDGGATWAEAASVDAASDAATNVVRSNLRRIRTSVAIGGPTHRGLSRSGICYDVFAKACRKNIQRATVRVLEPSLKPSIVLSVGVVCRLLG